MTLDPSPREDLADNGVFRPTPRAVPEGRRETVFFSDGRLRGPEAPVEFDAYGDDGRPCGAGDAVASRVTAAGRTRYYVKATPGGLLFDPRGVFTRPDEAGARGSTGGIAHYREREVAVGIFNNYLTYLRTGLGAYLRDAERAVANG